MARLSIARTVASYLPEEESIEWNLQYSADYFNFFMQGRSYPWGRDDIFERFRVPRNRTPRVDPALRPQRLPRPRRRKAFWRHKRTDDGSDKQIDDNVRTQLQAQGFTIGRILGAGSQGLAIEVTYQGQRMVLKYSSEIEAMVTEMWAMRKMIGAQHIVQRKWVPNFNDSGVNRRIKETKMNDILEGKMAFDDQLARILRINQDDEQQCRLMYLMEFMRHGNFNGLLRKISTEQRSARLKSSECWRMFHCFFRACVALSYPDNWDQLLDPETQDIPAREEIIPRDLPLRLFDGTSSDPLPPRSTEWGIIDFDMNDRNVMIGDYDLAPDPADPANPHPHDQVPVIKVGDFGVIRAYRTPRHRNMEALVCARVCGNRWCNTPEQFTQSWNNYGPRDEDALLQDGTAGNYDAYHTNLYMVAQLMTIMITQFQPDIPPDCIQISITKPTQPQQTDLVFTYGSHLVLNPEYNHLDPSLRATVAWCMAHRPADRPGMLVLETIIRNALTTNFPGDDDDDRDAINVLLNSPPPAPAQPPNPPGPGRPPNAKTPSNSRPTKLDPLSDDLTQLSINWDVQDTLALGWFL